jgi:hypothetical protein
VHLGELDCQAEHVYLRSGQEQEEPCTPLEGVYQAAWVVAFPHPPVQVPCPLEPGFEQTRGFRNHWQEQPEVVSSLPPAQH